MHKPNHITKTIAGLLIIALVIEAPGSLPVLAKSNKNKLNFSGVMGTSVKDQWASLGMSVAALLIGGYGTNGWSTRNAFFSFGKGMVTGVTAGALTNLAVDKWGFNPDAAQVFSYAGIGAIAGGFHSAVDRSNTLVWGNAFKGAGWGALQGSAIAGADLLAAKALKGSGLMDNNPFIARQVINLTGIFVGDLAFNGIKGMWDNRSLSWGAFKSGITIPNGFNRISAWDKNLGYLGKQALLLSVQYAASETNTFGLGKEYTPSFNTLLGSSINGGAQTWYGKLGEGLLSVGLQQLGGRYDASGKNKWNLTLVQMNHLTALGSGMLVGLGTGLYNQSFSTGWNSFKSQMNAWNQNFYYWGGSSPMQLGYLDSRYIEKIAQFSGLANYKYNADTAMRSMGYTSWTKFVGAGHHTMLLPANLVDMMVNYSSEVSQAQAIANLSPYAESGLYAIGTGTLKGIKAVGNYIGVTSNKAVNPYRLGGISGGMSEEDVTKLAKFLVKRGIDLTDPDYLNASESGKVKKMIKEIRKSEESGDIDWIRHYKEIMTIEPNTPIDKIKSKADGGFKELDTEEKDLERWATQSPTVPVVSPEMGPYDETGKIRGRVIYTERDKNGKVIKESAYITDSKGNPVMEIPKDRELDFGIWGSNVIEMPMVLSPGEPNQYRPLGLSPRQAQDKKIPSAGEQVTQSSTSGTAVSDKLPIEKLALLSSNVGAVSEDPIKKKTMEAMEGSKKPLLPPASDTGVKLGPRTAITQADSTVETTLPNNIIPDSPIALWNLKQGDKISVNGTKLTVMDSRVETVNDMATYYVKMGYTDPDGKLRIVEKRISGEEGNYKKSIKEFLTTRDLQGDRLAQPSQLKPTTAPPSAIVSDTEQVTEDNKTYSDNIVLTPPQGSWNALDIGGNYDFSVKGSDKTLRGTIDSIYTDGDKMRVVIKAPVGGEERLIETGCLYAEQGNDRVVLDGPRIRALVEQQHPIASGTTSISAKPSTPDNKPSLQTYNELGEIADQQVMVPVYWNVLQDDPTVTTKDGRNPSGEVYGIIPATMTVEQSTEDPDMKTATISLENGLVIKQDILGTDKFYFTTAELDNYTQEQDARQQRKVASIDILHHNASFNRSLIFGLGESEKLNSWRKQKISEAKATFIKTNPMPKDTVKTYPFDAQKDALLLSGKDVPWRLRPWFSRKYGFTFTGMLAGIFGKGGPSKQEYLKSLEDRFSQSYASYKLPPVHKMQDIDPDINKLIFTPGEIKQVVSSELPSQPTPPPTPVVSIPPKPLEGKTTAQTLAAKIKEGYKKGKTYKTLSHAFIEEDGIDVEDPERNRIMLYQLQKDGEMTAVKQIWQEEAKQGDLLARKALREIGRTESIKKSGIGSGSGDEEDKGGPISFVEANKEDILSFSTGATYGRFEKEFIGRKLPYGPDDDPNKIFFARNAGITPSNHLLVNSSVKGREYIDFVDPNMVGVKTWEIDPETLKWNPNDITKFVSPGGNSWKMVEIEKAGYTESDTSNMHISNTKTLKDLNPYLSTPVGSEIEGQQVNKIFFDKNEESGTPVKIIESSDSNNERYLNVIYNGKRVGSIPVTGGYYTLPNGGGLPISNDGTITIRRDNPFYEKIEISPTGNVKGGVGCFLEAAGADKARSSPALVDSKYNIPWLQKKIAGAIGVSKKAIPEIKISSVENPDQGSYIVKASKVVPTNPDMEFVFNIQKKGTEWGISYKKVDEK